MMIEVPTTTTSTTTTTTTTTKFATKYQTNGAEPGIESREGIGGGYILDNLKVYNLIRS